MYGGPTAKIRVPSIIAEEKRWANSQKVDREGERVGVSWDDGGGSGNAGTYYLDLPGHVHVYRELS